MHLPRQKSQSACKLHLKAAIGREDTGVLKLQLHQRSSRICAIQLQLTQREQASIKNLNVHSPILIGVVFTTGKPGRILRALSARCVKIRTWQSFSGAKQAHKICSPGSRKTKCCRVLSVIPQDILGTMQLAPSRPLLRIVLPQAHVGGAQRNAVCSPMAAVHLVARGSVHHGRTQVH